MGKTGKKTADQLHVGFDNLDRLRSMDPDIVDLVYLDPPFNKQKIFVLEKEDSRKKSFSDIWTLDDFCMARHLIMKNNEPELHALIEGIHAINGNDWLAYLSYMSARLLEMKRILKPTGSIYYHCDPTMSHGIKLMMDAVFGRENFRNEIVWRKTNSPKAQSSAFGEQHDIILYYTKSESFVFNKAHTKPDEKYLKSFRYEDKKGRYQTVPLVAAGLQKSDKRKQFNFRGVVAPWLHKKKTLEEWWVDGLIVKTNGAYRKKEYLSDSKGKIVSDIWADDDVRPLQGGAKESTGYPTQKPEALLKRIINTSSNSGDTVLDPFCGCATALAVANDLGRKWIGIDISVEVEDIIKKRIPSIRSHQINRQTKWNDQQGKGASRRKLIEHCLLSQKSPNGNNKYYCNGCGAEFDVDDDVTIDHYHPKKKGGVTYYSNIQLLCKQCNNLKGDKSMEYLYIQLAERVKKKRTRQGQQHLGFINPEIENLLLDMASKQKKKRKNPK